jgi:hypothetical protein
MSVRKLETAFQKLEAAPQKFETPTLKSKIGRKSESSEAKVAMKQPEIISWL